MPSPWQLQLPAPGICSSLTLTLGGGCLDCIVHLLRDGMKSLGSEAISFYYLTKKRILLTYNLHFSIFAIYIVDLNKLTLFFE